MKKLSGQEVIKFLNARQARERVVLLCAGLGIVGLVWLTFVHDPLGVAKETEARNITIANSRILEEQNTQAEINRNYTSDPNSFALSRQRELREAAENANTRLNQIYGNLVSPQQMSQMLTSILQEETTLELVSLDNNPAPESLIGATASADASADAAPGVQVFKHGMHMVFEGSFLETVDYLRSLERLSDNFFWENLEFELIEYPTARISLDIYTLSTQQGWIGV